MSSRSSPPSTALLHTLRSLILATGIAIGLLLCFQIALPFLPSTVWALSLAVLFSPLQSRLETTFKHPNLAASASILLIGLIVVVPSLFVAQNLVQQAAKGADLVKTKVSSGIWRRTIESQPRLKAIADRIEKHINLSEMVTRLASFLSNAAGSVVKGSVFQGISFCLTFYLLFFFLRDRHAALNACRSLLPLSTSEADHLFQWVADTIHATLYGTLAVSCVQGLLGGLMFWWLGLPAALLWGVVMALLAVIPVMGAFIVWIPAALFLLIEGEWGKALILSIWGTLVIGTIDNLLRPILVGNRLKLHTVLAFMSVVGGILVFGPSGLLLGPIILTITQVLLTTWTARTTH